jgi:hypothetical protein
MVRDERYSAIAAVGWRADVSTVGRQPSLWVAQSEKLRSVESIEI